MKTFLTHLLIAAIAAGTTWYLLSQKAGHSAPQPEVGARKLLYYQSPMHPWVKSEEPGRCTVCGFLVIAANHRLA